ncbi:RNase H domain-containing protein [Trichonephila clavipes]|nr:RNase H domain-containing protein [Trichonephila clavipes]
MQFHQVPLNHHYNTAERRLAWYITIPTYKLNQVGSVKDQMEGVVPGMTDMLQNAKDGSRLDTGRADSGIFSNTPGNDVKISIRNSDHCSVFRSELVAISGALDHAFNSYKDSISILAESRSSIQYLKDWPKIMDSTGLNILSKLTRLDQRTHVCLQWIPSHVGVPGNEAADELAGKGCDLSNHSSFVLSHSKIHSLYRTKMNLTWRNPPAHHWYAAKRVLAYLYSAEVLGHIRRPWRAFRSSHLRGMTIVQRQWSRDGTASRRPGSGRPRGTTEREDHRTAVAHRTASAAEIQAAVGTTVTQRTVRNWLLQVQLRARHQATDSKPLSFGKPVM